MFKQISYLKIGEHRSNKRIWLEGKRLGECGFVKGQPYTTTLDLDQKCIILKKQEILGDRQVSGKTNKKTGKTTPIIELCSQKLTDFVQKVFGDSLKVRVIFSKDEIKITLHHWERKKQERKSNLFNNILSGKITTGTLCAGGGISTSALHDGLKISGIDTKCEFIVDMESKYLQSAIENVGCITDDTRIFEASLEEIEGNLVNYVDILNISLPCTGHSKSGKSKNKIKNAEEHSSAGTAILGAINLIDAVNPSIIINENVPEFKDSATYSLFEGFLKQRGYKVEDAILDHEFAGTLERRKRHFFLAVSENCPEVSIDKLLPEEKSFRCINDILDRDIDDSEWKDYQYLAEKEKRDISAGKGFKRQLLTGEEESCGTIGKGYTKVRSTEPFLLSKAKSGFSRLFTPEEHARLKGIPEKLIKGLSKTVAHEILGQSVLYPIFVSFGLLLGETIKNTKNEPLLKIAV